MDARHRQVSEILVADLRHILITDSSAREFRMPTEDGILEDGKENDSSQSAATRVDFF